MNMTSVNANGTTPNVIFFGESGAGKSSVVNMLDGDRNAIVSDQATGVTFSNASYRKKIGRKTFKIFDTIGLNEGSRGTVKARDAVRSLCELMCRLDDGVSLLVYVMQAPRIKETAELNYKLFFETFCRGKVPIGILITGLEHRENMDEWWNENQHSFDKYRMKFADHACITATRGRKKGGKYIFQEEYDKSKEAVEHLVSTLCQEPWKMERKAWLLEILDKILDSFNLKPGVRRKQLAWALERYGGMSRPDAKAEAKRMEERRFEEEDKKMEDSAQRIEKGKKMGES